MTFHFGRELFCRKHRSAPMIPNLIESGKDWLGTIPKWGSTHWLASISHPPSPHPLCRNSHVR